MAPVIGDFNWRFNLSDFDVSPGPPIRSNRERMLDDLLRPAQRRLRPDTGTNLRPERMG
jgi:hypothetical protein